MRYFLMAVLILLYPRFASAAHSDQPPRAVSGLCETAIRATERGFGIPNRFLAAIATIESGRVEPETGLAHPWPWTIHAAGTQHFYAGKAEAVAAARAFWAHGIRSIDVGCMQINLLAHKTAFRSFSEAFDPAANALYGGAFLTDLFHRTGTWANAAAGYHSRTPAIASAYKGRVLAAWASLRHRRTQLPESQQAPGRFINVAWSLPFARTAMMTPGPEAWPSLYAPFPATLRHPASPVPDSGRTAPLPPPPRALSVATARPRTHIALRKPKRRGAQ
jgi:Transglycosylase SLT domain